MWRTLAVGVALLLAACAGDEGPGPGDDPQPADAGPGDGSVDGSTAGAGIDFRFLAALVGTCTARYRNPASMPLLDCRRLAALTP